ncbi:MAG: serine hydrolase domain-containing protein [Acidimicrobiales bacterium]
MTTVDAANLGFDADALGDAVRFAAEMRSTSVRVYRHGRLAAKRDRGPRSGGVPSPRASSSKGVLSLVVGRAVTLGMMGVDDPIGQYLPEADNDYGAITVRQLLDQTSGLRFCWAAEAAGLATDPVRQMLRLPFAHEPGATYEYAQTTLSVLGVIVERATGQEFRRFAQAELLEPLGIPRRHWVWLRDRSGRTITAGGMLLRPDDQARLG